MQLTHSKRPKTESSRGDHFFFAKAKLREKLLETGDFQAMHGGWILSASLIRLRQSEPQKTALL